MTLPYRFSASNDFIGGKRVGLEGVYVQKWEVDLGIYVRLFSRAIHLSGAESGIFIMLLPRKQRVFGKLPAIKFQLFDPIKIANSSSRETTF